jgi:hypothetical protein
MPNLLSVLLPGVFRFSRGPCTAFKTEVAAGASVGYIGGRLIKKEGS